jgi:hypothetical protein
MRDTAATMAIVQSLREIADALNAMRRELRQLKCRPPGEEPDPRPADSYRSGAGSAFTPLARQKGRGR